MATTVRSVPARKPIRVDILARPDSSPCTLFGLHEFLNSAGVGWETNVEGGAGQTLFEARIVAAGSEPFRCPSGLLVTPDATIADSSASEVALVPALATPAWTLPQAHDARELDWLRERRAQGGIVASACTGTLVLAASGVLDGCEATSHWAYRDLFRVHYPRVHLRLDRNLCVSGAGNRVVTCGGATVWHDLALHLIVRFWGIDHARRVARYWVLPERGIDQSPYSVLSPYIPHDDAVVRDCQFWAVDHFAEPNPVSIMARNSGLPRATFARRFRRATGYQPMEYVHAVRVDRAKEALERTERNIEEIGHEVGYEDAVSFRRLFKRKTGLTPSEYRRKFGIGRFRQYELAESSADHAGAENGV